jgi:hypothetical protein
MLEKSNCNAIVMAKNPVWAKGELGFSLQQAITGSDGGITGSDGGITTKNPGFSKTLAIKNAREGRKTITSNRVNGVGVEELPAGRHATDFRFDDAIVLFPASSRPRP